MLYLIPAPLHRLFYRLAHWGRKQWLRRRGGRVQGCCIIARDAEGRVLLVRHSYGSGRWSFPSGGMRADEDPRSAAQREFREELGCSLRDLRFVARVEEPFHGATNMVHLVAGMADGRPIADGRELVEARFFAVDALPPDCSRSVPRRLRLLKRC